MKSYLLHSRRVCFGFLEFSGQDRIVVGVTLNKGDFYVDLDWSWLLKTPLYELVRHTY